MTVIYPIDEIVDRLEIEEGYSATCYICSGNQHTVGFGRNIDPSGGMGISESEAEMLLRNDVERTIGECQRWPWFDDLDPARQSVIVQLCFQLGYPRLSGFNRMLSAISVAVATTQDYTTAAAELLDSRFAKQVPARANRLADKLRGDV
jgi:lysozyme